MLDEAEYNRRHASALALYNKPCGEDLPSQKFKRGSKVKVDDVMPPHMAHFPAGFEAIVEYTYAQQYGGNNIDSYSLIHVDELGNAITSTAWYYENQLTLVSDDLESGIKIILKYKERENP